MLICVGILAHNEEKSIARTVRSLLEQSVFACPEHETEYSWEIVVLPNGCTDKTHELAEKSLAEGIAGLPMPNVRSRVKSLDRPGKSNAWNELVHNISHPLTDAFVLIDADIEFGHRDTIKNSLGCLMEYEKARAVVDLPLNDLTRKCNPNFLEGLLARMSWTKFEGPPSIAGSFYCARGSTLREIWMPVGLPGEDGFLAAMILTDCFRSTPDGARVVRARDATHYYEGLTSVRKIIRHEVRLAIGSALNAYLCWETLVFLTDPSGPGAGELIRALNHEKPEWYNQMMATVTASRGLWALPSGRLTSCIEGRFRGWSQRSVRNNVLELPVRLGAIALDLLILWIANRKLRKNIGVGYW
jgi:hypothetical protein